MPFRSLRQMRWMFANRPTMARRWAEHTPDISSLPERAGSGSEAKSTRSDSKKDKDKSKDSDRDSSSEESKSQDQITKKSSTSIRTDLDHSVTRFGLPVVGLAKAAETDSGSGPDASGSDSESPPNYRWAELPSLACAACKHFQGGNYCAKYQQPVDASATCDAFSPKVDLAQSPPDLGTEFLPSPQDAVSAVTQTPDFFGSSGPGPAKTAESKAAKGKAAKVKQAKSASISDDSGASDAVGTLEWLAECLDPDQRPAEGVLLSQVKTASAVVLTLPTKRASRSDVPVTVRDLRGLVQVLSSLSELSISRPELLKAARAASGRPQTQSSAVALTHPTSSSEFQERCLRLERACYDPALALGTFDLERERNLLVKLAQARLAVAKALFGYETLDSGSF